MARLRIFKKDGTATPYFLSNEDGTDQTHKTVYKRTTNGVKRMKGVHFDITKSKFRKQ